MSLFKELSSVLILSLSLSEKMVLFLWIQNYIKAFNQKSKHINKFKMWIFFHKISPTKALFLYSPSKIHFYFFLIIHIDMLINASSVFTYRFNYLNRFRAVHSLTMTVLCWESKLLLSSSSILILISSFDRFSRAKG